MRQILSSQAASYAVTGSAADDSGKYLGSTNSLAYDETAAAHTVAIDLADGANHFEAAYVGYGAGEVFSYTGGSGTDTAIVHGQITLPTMAALLSRWAMAPILFGCWSIRSDSPRHRARVRTRPLQYSRTMAVLTPIPSQSGTPGMVPPTTTSPRTVMFISTWAMAPTALIFDTQGPHLLFSLRWHLHLYRRHRERHGRPVSQSSVCEPRDNRRLWRR